MTPDELRKIVDAWGGVSRFARILHVERSTIHRWLDGSRRIRPMVVTLIRSLEPR